jgi:hypothetical protein
MDEEFDPVADAGEPAPEPSDAPSLGDDLRQLTDDARALVEAELVWQKSRAVFAGKQAGGIAVLGLLAAALAFCALMALIFGMVLALVPLLTAWGATAAVSGGLLLAALLAGLLAALRARRMLRLIADRKPER